MTITSVVRGARRVAAFGMVAAAAFLVLWDGDRNERCTTTVVQTEDEPTRTETSCEPFALADVGLLAALGLLLLLPDLADLEIAGLVTLRRRLDHQQSRQDVLERQVLGLSQTVSQGTYVQLQVGALERSAERVDLLAPLLEPMEIEESDEATPSTIDLARIAELPSGSLEVQLATVAQRLRDVSRLATASEPTSGVSEGTAQALKRWQELFVREASMVEAVAARLGTATPPSEAEMGRALQLGLRLLGLLNQAATAAEVKKPR